MNKIIYSPSYELIQYLARLPDGEACHIPSLSELSSQMGISIARLREQLEVAKALGLVKIRPHTGMERLEYSFLPPVRASLAYSMQVAPESFQEFADLRVHIESSYWYQAVRSLQAEDLKALQDLIARAWDKLRGNPIQIPHDEHRELHLSLYRRLGNPFVIGILEAYWEAYEDVGLNLYADYQYLQDVWTYHQAMVDSICAQEYDRGYKALLDHNDLLHTLPGFQPQRPGNENGATLNTEMKKE